MDRLVLTKLRPPSFDDCSTQRLKLLSDCREARKPTLLSIVAPAGSGKTTLMSQLHRLLEGEGRAAAWITLDRYDDDFYSFSAYFLAALDQLAPESSQFMLEKNLAAFDQDSLSEVLIAHAAAISNSSIIFFDDFQTVTDPAVFQFMNRLLARLPESLCIVIASRAQLPLELGRIRVLGRLCEVDQHQLRFGVTEAGDFLKAVHGLELSLSNLTALIEVTEGWAAGLQLAALSLQNHNGPPGELIRNFSGCDRDLMSFLGESVFNGNSLAIREFMLLTGPLRRMCPELCRDVSGYPDCVEMLSSLERSGLFLFRLDRDGCWYRYHHLFQEFLTKRLQAENPEKYELVCEAAAHWCEANGLITEAIQYLLDIGQFERAADLIGDKVFDVAIMDGDLYTALDWMRRLPETYHVRRPEILLCRAWSLAFSRDPDLADSLANDVLRRLAKGDDSGWTIQPDSFRRLNLLGKVVRAISAGAMDALDTCHDRALPYCEEGSGNHLALIGAAYNCVSYGLRGRGDFSGAAAHSLRAVRLGLRSNSIYAVVWGYFLHGTCLLDLGEVRQAQLDGRQAQLVAESGDCRKSFAMSLAALLNAKIEVTRGNFEAASKLMEVVRPFALLFGPVEPLIDVFQNDARISAMLGDLPTALDRLAEGRETAEKSGYKRMFIALAIEEVQLLIDGGRVQEAYSILERLQLSERLEAQPADWCSGIWRILLRLVEAQILSATGKWTDALSELSKLQYAMGSGVSKQILIKLHCAKSATLWQLKRKPEAMRELDKALALAPEQDYRYPFLAHGPAIEPVLRAIQDHRSAEQDGGQSTSVCDVSNILANMSAKPLTRQACSSLIGPEARTKAHRLTSREIELLRLAVNGLSNKKLAAQLLISQSTVKWHMHNIYEKLQVANRTEAAVRAKDLRLI